MTSYLITGASRGIGLEFTRQLSEQSSVSKIFTTSRAPQPSAALASVIATASGKVVYLPCDVTKPEEARKAAEEVATQLGDEGLDVVINNVGLQTFVSNGIASMSVDDMNTVFTANVVGAQVTTAAFIELLKKGKSKKVINVSTTVGSIGMAEIFAPIPSPSYKLTKSALNMLTVQWALEYKKENFTILAISPGWLRTEMGGPSADLEVDVGIKACLNIIHNAVPQDSGKFLNIHVPGYENKPGDRYDGAEVAW